jgi:hypothetical protein
MSNTIYTFWEGTMPEYLQLCMRTWKFPYVMLNYNNVQEYIGKLPEKLLQLTLPKIADYIRVHVLNKFGGYWLDTDTIMLNDNLPQCNIMGMPSNRSHTIGFLYTEPQSDMYKAWTKYQDDVVQKLPIMKQGDTTPWNIMGNNFTDAYVAAHEEICIGDIKTYWPETYMVAGDAPRREKYIKFYFESNYRIDDLDNERPNMLMLHNSWTPKWYKQLNMDAVRTNKCTLSNIINARL